MAEFGLKPWEAHGGDPWLTYDELQAVEDYMKEEDREARKAEREARTRRGRVRIRG